MMLSRFRKEIKSSYSQSGEDLIVIFAFKAMGISNGLTYLDIGAHHPAKMSNTYKMYLQGNKGVCIEPNPIFFKKIKKHRRRDLCLNVGVGATSTEDASFYVLTHSRLSTFSREEADRICSYGKDRIEQVLKIPVIGINEILDRYFDNTPRFVSVDVEGLDTEIMRGMDLNRFRPDIFCIETMNYSRDGTEIKNQEIMGLMLENSYMVYADTYNNTIFIDKEKWRGRF